MKVKSFNEMVNSAKATINDVRNTLSSFDDAWFKIVKVPDARLDADGRKELKDLIVATCLKLKEYGNLLLQNYYVITINEELFKDDIEELIYEISNTLEYPIEEYLGKNNKRLMSNIQDTVDIYDKFLTPWYF